MIIIKNKSTGDNDYVFQDSQRVFLTARYLKYDNNVSVDVTTDTHEIVRDIDSDTSVSLIAFSNKSNFVDNEQIEITLTTPSEAIAKCQVAVYEEIPDTDLTNNDWGIMTRDTGFTLEDTATAVTLTPAATSGTSVEFTLGSGSWAAGDVGKKITNISSGEDGVANILSIASGVATCEITTSFTDTNAIASGDWKLESIEFVNNAAELSRAFKAAAAGTAFEFSTDLPVVTHVVKLTATTAISVFITGYSMKAFILTLDPVTKLITKGSVQAITGTANFLEIVGMTSSQILISYASSSAVSATIRVLDISGDTITPGATNDLNGGAFTDTSVCRLSDTTAIAAYVDSVTFFVARHVTIASSVCTADGNALVLTTGVSIGQLEGLSTLKGIYVETDRVGVISVSGDTLSKGSDFDFDAGTVNDARLRTIDTSTCLVTWTDGSLHLHGEILDISGTTVTGNTSTKIVAQPSGDEWGITLISASRMAIAAKGASEDSFVYFIDIASSLITTDLTIEAIDTNTTLSGDLANMDGSNMLCVFGESTPSSSHAVTVNDRFLAHPVNVHVPTISGTDSVDTTFFSDLNSMTVTETLNGETANYAFSFNPTFVSSEVDGGTFIVVGAGETTARNITSSLNSVHAGTEGVWHVNTDATYASETWVTAAIDNPYAALSEAMDTANNLMDGTRVNSVADSDWPAFGTTLSSAIILNTTDVEVTPSVSGISFNYDGNVINRLETDQYTIDQPSVNLVRVTAPSSGGPRNARIYISR